MIDNKRFQRRNNYNPPPQKPKSGFLFLWILLILVCGVIYYVAKNNKSPDSINLLSAEEQKAEAKSEEVIKIKAQASDEPQYEPIRNDDYPDLAIPNAHAFTVVDADTGRVLAGSHENERRQIASLAKIMTAVLTVEKIKDLNEPIEIGEEEVYVEGTKIGCPRSGYCISNRLQMGEKITARNLLQAMLMNSANDAAIALGKHIAGSQEAFTVLMNEKAKQMGLENTHFCTPSGLEIDGRESECFSSAADIARVAAYSMRYEEIWKMFRYPTNSEVASCDGSIVHTLINSDVALDSIPNCMGAKTGFTPLAGYSLFMGVSDKTHMHRVVIVLLDDPYRFQDVKTAIDWVFQAYDWKKI